MLGSASAQRPVALARGHEGAIRGTAASREEAFIGKLKAAAPQSEIKDLDPIVDALRIDQEPARDRRDPRGDAHRRARHHGGDARRQARDATNTSCRPTPSSCSRSAAPTAPSYFALIATGTNTLYSHYHKNTAMLADGDLVQFDYAPDYKYYQSDVTRVFPANGRFTPRQREFYTHLPAALSGADDLDQGPRVARATSSGDAVEKMDAIHARVHVHRRRRSRPPATAFVEGYRNRASATSLGHSVGMEVHDVGAPAPTLEPGLIFTIEPAMQIPDEHIGIRLEDMILITETATRTCRPSCRSRSPTSRS